MWYNININDLVILQLPTFFRKPIMLAYIQQLVKPIDSLLYRWQLFREDNLYKLEHTGQICYLRKALNDRFDIVQRRIYIGDGNRYEITYIYPEAEYGVTILQPESEPGTIYLRTEAETADTGLDFIVYVPQEIYNTQIYALHALIQFYKAGGKRYNIFINE
ncbi:hypothetical protein [Flavobacterium kingsejongi]|uniref:Uncharacterized protein n=1 Tax=Flavobacterium kingsejongi TaxID=1678728 RepID=A0A2S1LMC4_9FLAO|nr:hypothetical protein [Flavobacterium kingsejongi]AWG24831.1 hypothetical protein FK004_06100 [Flavobacterium kingsejongi]